MRIEKYRGFVAKGLIVYGELELGLGKIKPIAVTDKLKDGAAALAEAQRLNKRRAEKLAVQQQKQADALAARANANNTQFG